MQAQQIALIEAVMLIIGNTGLYHDIGKLAGRLASFWFNSWLVGQL